MKKETFDSIWDYIVIPIFENISDNSNILSLKNKDKVFKKYLSLKEEIKKLYMEKDCLTIDRHKIAAAMMKAIVEVSPIKNSWKYILKCWRMKKAIEYRYLYSNEYLGFFTALSILENFKSFGINGNQNLERRSIKIPDTFNETDYVKNTCMDLYFSKKNNQINILTFSNVFFLLEKYSMADSLK